MRPIDEKPFHQPERAARSGIPHYRRTAWGDNRGNQHLFYLLNRRDNPEILADVVEAVRLEPKIHFAGAGNPMREHSYPAFTVQATARDVPIARFDGTMPLDEMSGDQAVFLKHPKEWRIDRISQNGRCFMGHIQGAPDPTF